MSEINLPCKVEPWDGRIVDANDMYVYSGDVLRRINNHDRLVEMLERIVDGERGVNAMYEARTLLAELENQQ